MTGRPQPEANAPIQTRGPSGYRRRSAAVLRCLTIVALASWMTAACGDEANHDEPLANTALDISGVYDDGFSTHRVAADRWEIGDSVFHVDWVDGAARAAVARNDEANAFAAGLWSRFNWTTTAEGIWYCQIVFDAASRQLAIDSQDADASAPVDDGCGGFAWSYLRPMEPEISGRFDDGFFEHDITRSRWTQGSGDSESRFHLVQVDNDADFAVARNDDANPFAAGKWSRFDWIQTTDTLYYCQTAFEASTRADAAAARPARSQPAAAGCGGFAWSVLAPRPNQR